jgi:hypothetical protein
MNVRELFGLVVRAIGLWIFAQGVVGLATTILELVLSSAIRNLSVKPEFNSLVVVFSLPLVGMAVGAILLFRADGLVTTIYGHETT